MTRFMNYAAAMMMVGMCGTVSVWAGDATTSATATNGVGTPGTAAATANYTGNGGEGFARTRTNTAGPVNMSRGLAVGFDKDGLDVSFSHALALVIGPAYAGTFNMSIGMNGEVGTSYGRTLATGGLVRTAQAGGTTHSGPHGTTATATATGNTAPGGTVNAWTQSNTTPSRGAPVMARTAPVSYGRPAYGVGVRPVVRPIGIMRTMR